MTLETHIERLFDPARAAVDEGRIPGAALGIVRRGGERVVHIAGLAQCVSEPVPLRRDMWFDLASLTKVLFTTARILDLVAEGRLSLDDTLARHIPDLRQYDLTAPERTLTIRRLLTHQTHLPAVEPLYTIGQDPETLRAYVLQRVWTSGPSIYSDINFILLGILIERLTGRRLSEQPLPRGLSFAPPEADSVATERCSWRKRVMRGQVHDENAYALGGAAGHAGLFGTVDGVLDQALDLLEDRTLPATTRAEMIAPATETRALGWEIAHNGWHGGNGHSRRTIGHLGFTGTGLWIDFDRGIAWTLLTNRVHPSRHTETGIMALRREIGSRIGLLQG